MFFFVNPEGSTEGGATALKVVDRVATHVDAAATKAIENTLEASTKLRGRAAEAAQEAKQFITESMRQGQMRPALAGGPGNAFEPHVSQPKPKLNDHAMAMSSDGIGEGAAGDGLANAGKAGERSAGDAAAGDAVAGSDFPGKPKQVFYVREADNIILKEPDIILFGGLEKLENTSVEELAERGLRRFEMPELIVGRDGQAMTIRAEGHPRVYLRAEMKVEGEVTITDLFGQTLPTGTGNFLLSEGLRKHSILPSSRLILEGVVNEPTIRSYKFGDSVERSLLGKCATRALKSLGVVPIKYEWQEVGDALNIVITTGR